MKLIINFFLKPYNSKLTTFKHPPGVYTFKDLSEVLSRSFEIEFELRKLPANHKYDKSGSIIIESDNVSSVTKLISRYDMNVLRFVKKSFFNTVLGFPPSWDYKKYIGYDIEYYSEKNRKLSILVKNL